MKPFSDRRPPPDLLFDGRGKVALIAGGSGGIGQATAQRFLRGGARVVTADIQGGPPPEDTSVQAAITADLTTDEGVRDAVAACVESYGRLDYLVHAVGVTGRGPLSEVTSQEWHRVMDANLTSAFLLAREALPSLCESRGAVVFISSPNGIHGGTVHSGPAYAAAKAGVLNLARYLAREWAAHGITVNTVVPGTVDTPMLRRLAPDQLQELVDSVPLGRLTSPQEVAAAIVWLCSGHAAHMTGSTINITGGRLML